MRASSKYLFLLGLVASASVAARGADPFFPGDIDRAPSLNGLTGLVNLNMPYTMGAGLTAIGGATMAGAVANQYDSFTEVNAALRLGLSDNIEVGVKTKTFRVDPVTGGAETGVGDAEAMIKWKFRDQNENLPAMALGLGAMVPTSDKNKGFRETEAFGVKFSVMAGTELTVFEDGYVGLYGEAQLVAIDMVKATSPYQEMYGVVNVGLAFPISADNRLTFFTEYNQVTRKDVPTTVSNSSMVTPGLRYAHRNFSLTFAGQSVNFEDTGTSQTRLVGLISLGF